MGDSEYSFREVAAEITSAKSEINATIAREIARLEGTLAGHESNAWAHGPLRERTQHIVEDWQDWRERVDRWRYILIGGMSLLAFEITGLGGVAAIIAIFPPFK